MPTTNPDKTQCLPVAEHPARILIVDDEPHNRALLEVILTAEGYSLIHAASGEQALAMLAEHPTDLVLLDVMMPGMNGYEVATQMKDKEATKHIPIIMITALDDREGRIHGLSVGAEDFLTKPVDRAELCVRVRNLLRLKTYANELSAALADARDARMMAEHANSAKTLFLRSMSHELRTPLNAIAGFTEILELGIRGEVNPEQLKDLARIKRAANYLLRLINDVLTVARLEGARPLHPIAIAVNPVLAEVEGLCVNQARAKGVTLTATPLESDMHVTADAERLQQILLNLITNAIKFTRKGGSIAVTCGCAAGMMRIHVRDTGVGVSPADIDRVFEAFVQVDRHLTTAAQQGVGLGLSISRELARAMHGDLTLESTEGVGSTFTLTLPLAPEPSLESAAPHAVASASSS